MLAGVLGDFTGRDLTFAEIGAATRAIETFYADRGYLARVNVPAQEVVGNVVRLEIVEARYGGARLIGDPPGRVRAGAVTATFAAEVPTGGLLRPDRLDRPLLIANDLDGVAVSAVLAPGDAPGETILLLDTEDTDPFRTSLSFDNRGSRATGEHRLGFAADLASPFGQGGRLGFDGSVAEGARLGEVRYAVPLGARGLQAEIALEGLTYDVIAPELEALDATGSSVTLGATLAYPIIRARDHNLWIEGGLEHARYHNSIGGTEVSDYDVTRARFALRGDRVDDVGAGGATSYEITLDFGRVEGTTTSGAFSEEFRVLGFDVT